MRGRLLLTGGAGFIGSQLARTLIQDGWSVVVLDLLSYAGRREHLAGLDCELVVGDVRDPNEVARQVRGCQVIVHAAAESHVSRSHLDPDAFLRTNIEGTRVMLDAAQRAGVPRFIHVSTDEVFGSAPEGVSFGVDAPHRPGNAYAASKVGAEALVHAWRHSFDYPATIIRCTNNYGPRQHAEKAVPSWIQSALGGGPVPVHGQGTAVRDWLHVADLARGVARLIDHDQPGGTWHFAGGQHRRNRDMAARIAELCGGAVLAFGPERRGQDARYAIDDEATRVALGWAPRVPLDEGLGQTVRWYQEHRDLWS